MRRVGADGDEAGAAERPWAFGGGCARRCDDGASVAGDRSSCHRALMALQPQLQLGVSEFRNLREDKLVYVDKSLLIRG